MPKYDPPTNTVQTGPGEYQITRESQWDGRPACYTIRVNNSLDMTDLVRAIQSGAFSAFIGEAYHSITVTRARDDKGRFTAGFDVTYCVKRPLRGCDRTPDDPKE